MEKTNDFEEEVDTIDGYSTCSATKQQCLTDCVPPFEAPVLSDVN